MEIEKRSMESGSHSAGNYNVHLYTKILVALVCFILVLFSFIFMVTSSHAADPNQMLDRMATITLTGFINTATTTTNNTGNGTPPAGQQGSGLGIVFFPLLIGALLFMGIVIVLGFLLLRKRLLPPQPLRVNLPPSGAQPWRRVRTGSMTGYTN